MATENNVTPGEEHAPEEGKTVYRPEQADGKEIIDGARQDDQLKKQEENAEETPFEHHIGAMPSKDVLSQEDIENGVKTFEQESNNRMALETPDGKNNGAIPGAFEGQRS